MILKYYILFPPFSLILTGCIRYRRIYGWNWDEKIARTQNEINKYSFLYLLNLDPYANPLEDYNFPSITENLNKKVRSKYLFPDSITIDPYDPSTFGYTEFGVITRPHGTCGLLKIRSLVVGNKINTNFVHIKRQNRRSPREIRLLACVATGQKSEFLIKLQGINNRNDANRKKGNVIYIRNDENHEEDTSIREEIAIRELINCRVYVTYVNKIQLLGIVKAVVLSNDVLTGGIKQALLEVHKLRGKVIKNSNEMVQIPFVKEIVTTVNINEKFLHIEPPDGLLDLTYIKEDKVRFFGILPEGKDIVFSKSK